MCVLWLAVLEEFAVQITSSISGRHGTAGRGKSRFAEAEGQIYWGDSVTLALRLNMNVSPSLHIYVYVYNFRC